MKSDIPDRSPALTTGQIARCLKVAPKTVCKWFDEGLLKGWRIPGSRDRRVERAEFERFCLHHEIPLSVLEDLPARMPRRRASA